MLNEIVRLLLEKEKTLTPEEKTLKNRKELLMTAERGQSAMELENSKAFKDIIEPFVMTTLLNNIKDLILSGLEYTNDEKNIRIAKMQGVLNLPTYIEKVKEEAKKAGGIISIETKIVKKKEEREILAREKQKTRDKIINRMEKNEKRKIERKEKKT